MAGLASQQGLGQFGAGLFQDFSGDQLDLATLLGAAGIDLQTLLSGQTIGADQQIRTLGIGLDASTLTDLTNAQVNFGQFPFGYDINLTGSEVGLDLAQMTQEGVSPLIMLQQLG